MTLPMHRWGRGPVQAVFLHGFAGSSHSFDHLEGPLGDALTATCLELPGHGESPPVESWSEAVSAVGAQLPARAVLIGYSQGARVALAVAQAFPNRVERVVLESVAPGFRRRHERSLRRKADAALADLLLEQGLESFMNQWERLPLFAGVRRLPGVEQAALRARRTTHRPHGLAAALRVLGQGAQPDLWPGLQAMRVPTLLLTGADDEKYTRLARKMATDLPLAWRRSFRGVGHAPHLECAEEYANEVRSFLQPAWSTEPVEHAP